MIAVIRRYLMRLAIGYVLLLLALFVFQRSLMYHPDTHLLSPQEHGVQAQIITLQTPDNQKLTAWYMPAAKGMPTILHLHGNAGNLGRRHEVYNAYHAAGFGVLALEWRGYGTSTGNPSEEGFYTDARTAMKWLNAQGIANSEIVLYGESIGSGPAVQMATEIDAKALVLEAPFASLWARAGEIYWYVPTRFLVRDRYDNLTKIKNVTEPLLMLHNTGDTVVPIHHGKALFDAANEPKKIEIFEHDGHVSFDRPMIAQKMKAFLKEND